MADLGQIEAAVEGVGLTLRGGFHPTPEDGVPALEDGRAAQTLILLGNVGPAMWRSFQAARIAAEEPLDSWSQMILDALAAELGASAFFPFTRPHLPFQRWARRAEPCHSSPLGLLIHPDHGLWHGYRGALAFAEHLALPAADERPCPCDSCAEKPCLTSCPVSAFGAAGYDVPTCVAYLETAPGDDCLGRGCQARRACPVGRENTYEPAQARFHMAAFLRRRQAARAAAEAE